jgi:transposase
MTLLLGALLFVALLIYQFFMNEGDAASPTCPKCGIERMREHYDRERTYFVCPICQKRWKRGIDGALVIAEPV